MLLLSAQLVSGMEQDILFRHLTLDNGLSNSNINYVAQDRNGFIWIGTENGLNRFDGYTFKTYYSGDSKSNSLYSDEVFSLCLDRDGTLWIATFQGLFRYNEDSDDFTHISFIEKTKNRYDKPILDILEDKNGILWLATSGDGLIAYDRKKDDYTIYMKKGKGSISSNYLLTLYLDNEGFLWIGTELSGFDRMDTVNGTFMNFNLRQLYPERTGINSVLTIAEPETGRLLIGTRAEGIYQLDRAGLKLSELILYNGLGPLVKPKEINGILKDSKGRTWISSIGNGLYYYDDSPDNCRIIQNFNVNDYGLLNRNTRTIFEDKDGNLWIVSYQGGLNFLPNRRSIFTSTLLYERGSDRGSNIVTTFAMDNRNNLWIGTDGGGLNYYDRRTGKLNHYLYEKKGNLPAYKVVMDLVFDHEGNLWIGSYLEGLTVYNPGTGKSRSYENSDAPYALSNNFVTTIFQDQQGTVWVGTNGGGLNRYLPEKDGFENFTVNDTIQGTYLVNNWINALEEDYEGRIWIGTFWGLSIYDPIRNYFTNFLAGPETRFGITNNVIYCLKESSRKEMWIGTRNGLHRFIPDKGIFEVYNTENGLPGNIIYGIQEDGNGELWVSTNRGICNFNPESLETHNYFVADGLQSNEFFRNSSYKARTGEMFFGNINGMVSFFPDSTEQHFTIPYPLITDFHIYDQRVEIGKEYDRHVILNKPIYRTDTIVIREKDKLISFTISALDYFYPEKNLYKTKLEGFDADWRPLDYSQRTITYTNLDAGTYIFKVKASNILNEWDESKVRQLVLIIKPPFYKTWWAYMIYILIIIALVLLIWNFALKRMNLLNQIRIERLERNKAEEINQAKLQFFTNISHEFRTPLTLIVGPVNKMISDKVLYRKYKESLDLILRNTDRLLRLIDQLMDFRKSETGKVSLKVEKADIIAFIRDIHATFNELAEEKSIDFRFLTEFDTFECWFDKEKLEKMVYNLLSNAFKYTRANGEIALTADMATEEGSEYVKISVIDSGIGISRENLDRIFERFYQVQDQMTMQQQGYGIGLFLTKSLIQQHHGLIRIQSESGRGTEISLLLPIDESVFLPGEKAEKDSSKTELYVHRKPVSSSDESSIIVSNSPEKKHTLLIVEDDLDLRKYLINELASAYNILHAGNGKDGLKKALDKQPDLVISDVLMDEMDGLELCSRIKENFITNHIPVILLTARTTMEQHIAGIRHGADAYIYKPFEMEHLTARIEKLLESRNVLKAKYSGKTDSEESMDLPQNDPYLREFTEMVLQKIDDPQLNINMICNEMGVSRAQFYRKIKLITDKSPTEFIRVIRLNEAARLLSEGNVSVSEVCYKVGFNFPSYFSICFKEQFHISPTDFAKKVRKSKN